MIKIHFRDDDETLRIIHTDLASHLRQKRMTKCNTLNTPSTTGSLHTIESFQTIIQFYDIFFKLPDGNIQI